MRVGLNLPQWGPGVAATEISGFARDVEVLGYESLWVADRLLAPVEPVLLYPDGGTPEEPYPAPFKAVLDPIVLLTVAASSTQTLRLGSGTVNAPWYNPVLLARALTALDEVSGGRLDVGFGIGWSPDEYAAA
ncbi:LLM class flavin-dependent oxidoreductase, partial [Streptomyces misionensis]|uniref:LLM class flavin-dependent oxidoreductase n=1 Tax=Streptomyces misionensis TaxID=67331 RepID=UPI0033DC1A9E